MLLGEGSEKVAVPFPEKKIEFRSQIYDLWCIQGVFSSSVSLVLMQVTPWMIRIIYLFFISTSGGKRGPRHPRPLPESATDEHTDDELSAVGLLSRSTAV